MSKTRHEPKILVPLFYLIQVFLGTFTNTLKGDVYFNIINLPSFNAPTNKQLPPTQTITARALPSPCPTVIRSITKRGANLNERLWNSYFGWQKQDRYCADEGLHWRWRRKCQFYRCVACTTRSQPSNIQQNKAATLAPH